MSAAHRVSATLQISDGLKALGEPIDARVLVEEPGPDGTVAISIKLESGVEWLLEFDPACAAYVAGGLAHRSGVILG